VHQTNFSHVQSTLVGQWTDFRIDGIVLSQFK